MYRDNQQFAEEQFRVSMESTQAAVRIDHGQLNERKKLAAEAPNIFARGDEGQLYTRVGRLTNWDAAGVTVTPVLPEFISEVERAIYKSGASGVNLEGLGSPTAAWNDFFQAALCQARLALLITTPDEDNMLGFDENQLFKLRGVIDLLEPTVDSDGLEQLDILQAIGAVKAHEYADRHRVAQKLGVYLKRPKFYKKPGEGEYPRSLDLILKTTLIEATNYLELPALVDSPE